MPDVVLVLPFEYQPPIAVVLLGRAVQLPIHVGAMKDHSILVGVDSLALQGIINVVPLQGADGERQKTEVENWLPLRGEPKAATHWNAKVKSRNSFLWSSKGSKQLPAPFHQGVLHGHSITHSITCLAFSAGWNSRLLSR